MKKYIKPAVEIIDVNAQEMLIALSGSEANSTYPGGGDARVLDFQDIDLGNSLDSETFDLSFDFENM
ncbi:MAG: hypothetical protein KBT34_05345 [Prevotella sp.]|nr:hypothetical protein [Candidatus Prevotella equi]